LSFLEERSHTCKLNVLAFVGPKRLRPVELPEVKRRVPSDGHKPGVILEPRYLTDQTVVFLENVVYGVLRRVELEDADIVVVLACEEVTAI